MKKCSYCGAEYPDEAVRCALDHTSLLDESRLEKRAVDRAWKFLMSATGSILGALFLLFVGAIMLVWIFDLDRSRDFRKNMREGRPLVLAIETFRTNTGSYPQSLDELAPKYTTGIATNARELGQKFGGWDYYRHTNDEGVVTYTLMNYNMGHAGIDYTPPYWTGNVDGSRRVLRKGL